MVTYQEKLEESNATFATMDLSDDWSTSFDRDFMLASVGAFVLWGGLLSIAIVSGDFSIAFTPLMYSVFGGAVLYFGGKMYALYEHRLRVTGQTKELKQDSIFFAITGVVMALLILVVIALIVAWIIAPPTI